MEPGARPPPLPAARSQLSTISSQCPRTVRRSRCSCISLATHHDNHIFLAGRRTTLGLRGHQSGALYLLHLTIHVLLLWPWWCGFKELCQIFSSLVSWREGTCWETGEAAELTRWPSLPSGYQKTWPSWLGNGLNAMECVVHLEKIVNRSLLELH